MTAPSSFRGQVVCNDDCDNCPLYNEDPEKGAKGCAARCVRWGGGSVGPSVVCHDCPCLGSLFADAKGEPDTVNPREKVINADGKIFEKATPALPRMIQLRNERRAAARGSQGGIINTDE